MQWILISRIVLAITELYLFYVHRSIFEFCMLDIDSLLEATFTVSEWTEIPLDPKTVKALVDGNQYGIAIWQPDIGINLDLASREANGGQNATLLLVRARGFAVDRRCRLITEWGRMKGF